MVAWLPSAFSSIRTRCPKKVRRRDLMMDESGGWLVMRRMSAFLTKLCHECPGLFVGTIGPLHHEFSSGYVFLRTVALLAQRHHTLPRPSAQLPT